MRRRTESAAPWTPICPLSARQPAGQRAKVPLDVVGQMLLRPLVITGAVQQARDVSCGSSAPVVALIRVRRCGLEGQRAGVDAVAVTRRGGPVGEYMAKMATTGPTNHLGAVHEQAVVRPQLNGLGDRRLVEARPARARIELGVGSEQLAPAACAAVRTVVMVAHILAGERPLGVALAQDAVLLGS